MFSRVFLASARKPENPFPYACFLALINTSSLLLLVFSLGNRLVLAISFSLLLTRFLWTLFFPYFGTTIPIRGLSLSELAAKTSSAIVLSFSDLAASNLLISAVLVILSPAVKSREVGPSFPGKRPVAVRLICYVLFGADLYNQPRATSRPSSG